MKKILSVLFIITISGCLPTDYSKSTPMSVANKVEIKNSSFDSKIKYIGPDIRQTTYRGAMSTSDYENFKLRGWKDKKTGEKKHQIYITIKYDGRWRFYSSASFDSGETTKAVSINKEVVACYRYSGCTHSETFGINVNDSFLSDHVQDGFQIRAESKGGFENILTIPGQYISGYLLAIK